MYEAMELEDWDRVANAGAWIRQSHKHRLLALKGFKLPVDPLYVPFPPAARSILAGFSSTIVDPSEPEDAAPVAGPSTARTGQIPDGGPTVFGTGESFLSFPSLPILHLPLLLGFGEIPNDGVGRTATTRSRGLARAQLKTARERRHREATPEHELRSLPKLISAKDLVALRKDVSPVSFIFLLFPTHSDARLQPYPASSQMQDLLRHGARLLLARLVCEVRGMCSQQTGPLLI